MIDKTWILGIDNGISGSFCLMDPKGNVVMFDHVPTYKEIKWTKPKITKTPKKKIQKIVHETITLIDIDEMRKILVNKLSTISDVQAFLERPAISYAAAWSMQTSISAAMSWAYMVNVLRRLNIPRTDVDSKEWQKALIPEALGENNKEYMKSLKAGERNKLLKKASDKLALDIYPKFKGKELGDGDSICLAQYGLLKVRGLI